MKIENRGRAPRTLSIFSDLSQTISLRLRELCVTGLFPPFPSQKVHYNALFENPPSICIIMNAGYLLRHIALVESTNSAFQSP
jgi:hypothetical protein